MTKIDFPKLIGPNDYQPFYIWILCFFGVFFLFWKSWFFNFKKEPSQKSLVFDPNPHFFTFFCKVHARVIIIAAFLPIFGEKMCLFWFTYGFDKGRVQSTANPRSCKRSDTLFEKSLLLFSTRREYFYSQPTHFSSQQKSKDLNKVSLLLHDLVPTPLIKRHLEASYY